MPRGDKSKYTDKQKRQAAKIEAGYKERGVSEDEAEARAWATVNKTSGGGNKPGGSGYGSKKTKAATGVKAGAKKQGATGRKKSAPRKKK